jgi:hypothetical protein
MINFLDPPPQLKHEFINNLMIMKNNISYLYIYHIMKANVKISRNILKQTNTFNSDYLHQVY